MGPTCVIYSTVTTQYAFPPLDCLLGGSASGCLLRGHCVGGLVGFFLYREESCFKRKASISLGLLDSLTRTMCGIIESFCREHRDQAMHAMHSWTRLTAVGDSYRLLLLCDGETDGYLEYTLWAVLSQIYTFTD